MDTLTFLYNSNTHRHSGIFTQFQDMWIQRYPFTNTEVFLHNCKTLIWKQWESYCIQLQDIWTQWDSCTIHKDAVEGWFYATARVILYKIQYLTSVALTAVVLL